MPLWRHALLPIPKVHLLFGHVLLGQHESSSLPAVVPGHSHLGGPTDLTSSPGSAVRFTALSSFITRTTDLMLTAPFS